MTCGQKPEHQFATLHSETVLSTAHILTSICLLQGEVRYTHQAFPDQFLSFPKQLSSLWNTLSRMVENRQFFCTRFCGWLGVNATSSNSSDESKPVTKSLLSALLSVTRRTKCSVSSPKQTHTRKSGSYGRKKYRYVYSLCFGVFAANFSEIFQTGVEEHA